MGAIQGIISDETKYFRNLTLLLLDSTYKSLYGRPNEIRNPGAFSSQIDNDVYGYDIVDLEEFQ